jgi:hypothetical protein
MHTSLHASKLLVIPSLWYESLLLFKFVLLINFLSVFSELSPGQVVNNVIEDARPLSQLHSNMLHEVIEVHRVGKDAMVPPLFG